MAKKKSFARKYREPNPGGYGKGLRKLFTSKNLARKANNQKGVA